MRLGNPGLAVDSQLEADGKWIDCPRIWWRDSDTPMRVLLRGAASKEHQAIIRKVTKGLSREQIEERDSEILSEITAHLVAGWEGTFDTDGNAVRYSPETCRSILANPDNRRFVDFVSRMANDISTFTVGGDAEKN